MYVCVCVKKGGCGEKKPVRQQKECEKLEGPPMMTKKKEGGKLQGIVSTFFFFFFENRLFAFFLRLFSSEMRRSISISCLSVT